MSKTTVLTKRIRVTFEQEVPIDATPEDVDEWAKFYLGRNGALRDVNMLSKLGIELEATCVTIRDC